MKLIAEVQRKRVQLTASRSVTYGRITVTVNAEAPSSTPGSDPTSQN